MNDPQARARSLRSPLLGRQASGAMVIALALMVAGCQPGGMSADPKLAAPVDKGNAGNIASLSQVIANNPRDANALNLRGAAYGRQKDFNRAIADFDQAIAIDPQYYQAFANRALIRARQNRLDLAMADFNRSLEIEPNYGVAYLGRAEIYALRKDYPLALADYSRAIDLRGEEAIAYFKRGAVYQILGQHESAIDDFTQAINLRPNDSPEPNYARGLSYMALGRWENAAEDFLVVGRRDRNNVEAWTLRGEASEKAGDIAEAKSAYKRALGINPSHRRAQDGLKRVAPNDA